MPYSALTLSGLATQLSQRLGDTGKVFWTDIELQLCLKEALRLLNVLTRTQRVATSFTTSAGIPFYDLASVTGPATYRSRSIRDRDIVREMQHHLLEPAIPPQYTGNSIWSGTDMFTHADVLNALQQRRDRFLLDTAAILTRSLTVYGAAPAGGVFPLSPTTMMVRRAAWTDAHGKTSILGRTDELAMGGVRRAWSSSTGEPWSYSILAGPQLTIQLSPAPTAAGTLDLITVESGAALDINANSGTGTLLGIPDDFCWAVKWGAIADLLAREGPARDLKRAEFCEGLYLLGVELCRGASSVLDSSVEPSALFTIDRITPRWQSRSAATPRTLGLAGLDLVALSPVPNTSGVVVSLSLVRATDISSPVQVSYEYANALLAWAQHLAMFKCGGTEFTATSASAKAMFDMAKAYTGIIRTSSVYMEDMYGLARSEDGMRPFYSNAEMTQPDNATTERRRDSHGAEF